MGPFGRSARILAARRRFRATGFFPFAVFFAPFFAVVFPVRFGAAFFTVVRFTAFLGRPARLEEDFAVFFAACVRTAAFPGRASFRGVVVFFTAFFFAAALVFFAAIGVLTNEVRQAALNAA
jgi:hypothetical protein